MDDLAVIVDQFLQPAVARVVAAGDHCAVRSAAFRVWMDITGGEVVAACLADLVDALASGEHVVEVLFSFEHERRGRGSRRTPADSVGGSAGRRVGET